MTIKIKLDRYTNPFEYGGKGWMAHSDEIEAAGVYGFGATETEAADHFEKEFAHKQINGEMSY